MNSALKTALNPFCVLTATLALGATASFGQIIDIANLSFEHGIRQGQSLDVIFNLKGDYVTSQNDTIVIREPYTNGNQVVAQTSVGTIGQKSGKVSLKVDANSSLELPCSIGYDRGSDSGNQRVNLWVFPSKQIATGVITPQRPAADQTFSVDVRFPENWTFVNRAKIEVFENPQQGERKFVTSTPLPEKFVGNHFASFPMKGLPKGNYTVRCTGMGSPYVWPLIVK